MLHGHHNLLFGFDQCLWNASLSHGKMRQNNELHADLASFLFNCAIKTLLFGVHAEILLFLFCAEILLSRVIAPRESCAGPVGVVQKY